VVCGLGQQLVNSNDGNEHVVLIKGGHGGEGHSSGEGFHFGGGHGGTGTPVSGVTAVILIIVVIVIAIVRKVMK
jgi:hypothetical protein